MSEDRDRAQFIRASELSDYVYCQRQWWLKRVNGVRSENVRQLKAGTAHHEEHWRQVRTLGRNRRIIFVLIVAAISMFLLALFL